MNHWEYLDKVWNNRRERENYGKMPSAEEVDKWVNRHGHPGFMWIVARIHELESRVASLEAEKP